MSVKNSYFISDEHNFDVKQSLLMQQNKNQVTNETESKKVNTKIYDSINDTKTHVNCLNGKCCDLGELNNEFDNLKNKTKTNNHNNKNGLGNFLPNINNLDNLDDFGILSFFKRNLNILVNFVYLFLIAILLFNSVVHRSNVSLIQIIFITLIYVLYKIIMG